MRERMDRLVRTTFWLAMGFALLMASLPKPPHLPGDPSDKVLHIIAFVCLAALAALAYPRTSRLKLFLGLSAFGVFIELVQLIAALHRDSDLIDWVADSVAAAAVLGAVYLWQRTRRMAQP